MIKQRKLVLKVTAGECAGNAGKGSSTVCKYNSGKFLKQIIIIITMSVHQSKLFGERFAEVDESEDGLRNASC